MNFRNQQLKLRWFFAALTVRFIFCCVSFSAPAKTISNIQKPLRVAVAGTAPFVVANEKLSQGIAVEIWQDVAARTGWKYKWFSYPSVPEALVALQNHQVDVVVGPTSISSKRARLFQFTQPYFQSSLSILSPVIDPTFWQRVAPFFSKAFFVALAILIFFLFVVGTLFWLAERHHEGSDFPVEPLPGIASGMWCAIVTMTTVGYGDIAPKTAAGRVIAATWMTISIVAATSLVAGLASTISLSRDPIRSITTAEDLHDHTVAVLSGSPGQGFAERYGAKIQPVNSLDEGYKLLKKNKVDAVIFDRPQLLYFLQQRHDAFVKVSTAQYQPQGYGFAFPLHSALAHKTNVQLLELEESGRVDQIVHMWLGNDDDE